MPIQEKIIEPKYKRENGLYVLDLDSIKIPFKIKERSIVYLPSKQIGGNHKHPRREAFIGIGEGLELVLMVGDKKIRKKMNPKGKVILFVIPPNLGHAVINRSNNSFGILLEFADDIQNDVLLCKIIK